MLPECTCHHQHHISNTRRFYGELDQLPKSKQPLTQGDIEEMISLLVNSSEDFGKSFHLRAVEKYSVCRFGDIFELYTKGGEFRGKERPRALVVAKEDVCETLCKAHDKLCHVGRFRMWAYLEKNKLHITRSLGIILTTLLYMPGEEREMTTKRIVHKPIIPPTVGQCAQSDLIDLRMQEDNRYKYSRNEWKSTRFVHGRPRKFTYQGSIERANQDVELLFARLRSLKKPLDQWVSELKYVQYTTGVQ